MRDAASLDAVLRERLDRVHLQPEPGRVAVELVGAAAHHDATDAVFPRACLLMGRVALATGDHTLAEAPLLRAISAARGLGDIDLAVRAAAALAYARSPMRFADDAAQQAAELIFARRLAAGADRLELIAERVRLDLCRAAHACRARRVNHRLGLGLGAAAMLALGWATQADSTLRAVIGDRASHWAERLAQVLPGRPTLPADMLIDDRLAPDVQAWYPTAPEPVGVVAAKPCALLDMRSAEARAAVEAGAPLVIVGDPVEGAALAAAWLGPILPGRERGPAAHRAAKLHGATLAWITDAPVADGPRVQLVAALDGGAWQDETAVLITLTQ